MGNQTIHINRACYTQETISRPPTFLPWKSSSYISSTELSEAEIYKLYAQPVIFKNKIDWHMRLRHDPAQELLHSRRKLSKTDLRFLRVSRELYVEASKLLYPTNMWSFDDAATLEKWLGKRPENMLPHIRHVRLDMALSSFGFSTPFPRGTAVEWEDALRRLVPVKLTGLRTLSLVLCLDGFVTCWRKSQATTVTEMFKPFRSLKHLRNVYVIFEEHRYVSAGSICSQPFHDVEAHRSDPKHTFWRRKEVGRAWAEEIRAMILDDKDLPGQVCEGRRFLSH